MGTQRGCRNNSAPHSQGQSHTDTAGTVMALAPKFALERAGVTHRHRMLHPHTGGIVEETVSTRRGQEGRGTHTRCTAPFACTSCARGRRAGAPTHGVHSTVHGHCAQKWFKSSAFVRCRATEHTPGTGNHARDVQDKCMLAREPRPTRGDRVRST